MRLLIADDHNLFRDALVQYIERAEPSACIVLARDIHEVMERLETEDDIDLVLLDLRMPGMNGLQGLEKLRETYPEVSVALMSGLAEPKDIEDAVVMGITGYFPKTLSGKAMMNGIRHILRGENFIALDHNTNEYMPSHYHDPGFGNYPGHNGSSDVPQIALNHNADINLTPREKEVLSHLLQGQSNKEIARDLDLQVVTIKLHVRGICRKLHAKNRTQAALMAQQHGLI